MVGKSLEAFLGTCGLESGMQHPGDLASCFKSGHWRSLGRCSFLIQSVPGSYKGYVFSEHVSWPREWGKGH